MPKIKIKRSNERERSRGLDGGRRPTGIIAIVGSPSCLVITVTFLRRGNERTRSKICEDRKIVSSTWRDSAGTGWHHPS